MFFPSALYPATDSEYIIQWATYGVKVNTSIEKLHKWQFLALLLTILTT